MTLLEQPGHESTTDVAGGAGDEDALYDEDRWFVTFLIVASV